MRGHAFTLSGTEANIRALIRSSLRGLTDVRGLMGRADASALWRQDSQYKAGFCANIEHLDREQEHLSAIGFVKLHGGLAGFALSHYASTAKR